MSVENKFPSKDGHYYDTVWEKIGADSAWEKQREEQKKQNDLIAEQNELLNEQMQLQADMAEKQMEFEREQAEMQRQELEKQREHEEKMRILGLFDSIGLNKRYYDDFIEYLTMEKNQNLADIIDEKSKIIYYLDKITKILKNPINTVEDELSNYNTFVEKNISDCYIFDNKSQKLVEKFKLYLDTDKPMKLTENDINKFNSFNKEKFKKLKLQRECNISKVKVCIIVFVISCLLEFITIGCMEYFDSEIFDNLFILFFLLMAITCIPMGVYGSKASSGKEAMSEILNKEIKNFKTEKLDEKKIVNKCNKLKTNYSKQLKEINTKIAEEILPKWENFVDFRKSHYNSKFEKLLLDLELKEQIEKLGIEYLKINTKNKTGDGSIEDYIAYFDSL